MRWETIECTRCGELMAAPIDCIERVKRGLSYVLCEACMAEVKRAGRGFHPAVVLNKSGSRARSGGANP